MSKIQNGNSLSDILKKALSGQVHQWLVTGAAGFIGSHLVEHLLMNNQIVKGLDNFATGSRWNLEDVRKRVGEKLWENFSLIEGDIRNSKDCQQAVNGVTYVLHQAALGSVPKSIADPSTWTSVNVQGTVEILVAAKNEPSVKGFVYASSSSVYGDSPILPKKEDVIGTALSPYAVSKYSNELYSQVFYRCYNFASIGLRYFNVFGARQDPNGAYAAVIPKWIQHLLKNETCVINGDGQTTRDFCYIDNVVQANILSALNCQAVCTKANSPKVFNVGVGENTSLIDLYGLISNEIASINGSSISKPSFVEFREGDIRHSLADVSSIKTEVNFQPTHTLAQGIKLCVPAYVEKFAIGPL